MDEIAGIEESLREALQHVPAPNGFEARVLARVAAESAPPAALAATRGTRPERALGGTLLHMRPAAGWWAAAAAALLLSIGGGDALHLLRQHQQQREAAAQQQVDLAMQLTNHALNEVEVNLHRSHAGKFTQLWNGSLQ